MTDISIPLKERRNKTWSENLIVVIPKKKNESIIFNRDLHAPLPNSNKKNFISPIDSNNAYSAPF